MPRTNGMRQNEIIFEVRFKPNTKALDRRGEWAEALTNHTRLEHWQIDQNRIDVFSKDREIHAYVSFRNAGLTVNDVPNRDYFPNYADNFLSFVFELNGFGDTKRVERIGVRKKFCTPFTGSFEELMKRYSTRYLIIPEKAWEAIGPGSKLADIGGHLNFADQTGNFNTMSGPMLQKQFSDYFSNGGQFPTVGLYYEIDYWVRPQATMSGKDVIATIQNLFSAGWERHLRIRDLIIKR